MPAGLDADRFFRGFLLIALVVVKVVRGIYHWRAGGGGAAGGAEVARVRGGGGDDGLLCAGAVGAGFEL